MYFVTICTEARKFLFGEVVEGEMFLNEAGCIVQKTWDSLPGRFKSLVLDVFQVMPNHVHGVFVLPGPGLDPALARATGAPVIQPYEDRRGRACPTPVAVPPDRRGRACPTPVAARPDRWGDGKPSPYKTVRGDGKPSPSNSVRGGGQGMPSRIPTGANGTAGPRRTSMGDVVGAFKSISTIAVNKLLSRTGTRLLHENFYEHIVRDVSELGSIRDYIIHNPQRWLDDPENPQSPAFQDWM